MKQGKNIFKNPNHNNFFTGCLHRKRIFREFTGLTSFPLLNSIYTIKDIVYISNYHSLKEGNPFLREQFFFWLLCLCCAQVSKMETLEIETAWNKSNKNRQNIKLSRCSKRKLLLFVPVWVPHPKDPESSCGNLKIEYHFFF